MPHICITERECIFLWTNLGVSHREIARRLNRDHSSINYEIMINTKFGKKYSPSVAQKRADRVGNNQRYKAPLKGPEIFLYVRQKLRTFWSPETIACRLQIDIKNASIDTETIYRYIYSASARRYKLWKYLPCARKKRMKKLGRKVRNKGKIPNAVSIDSRSKVVAKRKQVGHWETDNVEGPRSSHPALSVTVERKTRFHIISKIPNQTASQKHKVLVERLTHFKGKTLRSCTQDHGKENSFHEKTSKVLGIKMFFCHAYHSWEKGTVENRNKSIRRFFPKGTDFSLVSDRQVQAVENILNNRPMKCLNSKTPNEMMSLYVPLT
jgi:transposase, IS30 family